VSRREKWDVQVYEAHVVSGAIEQEAEELNRDEKLRMGVAALIGWLKQARVGEAHPEAEPELAEPNPAGNGGRDLRYRAVSDVVLIFGLMRAPPRLVVLRLARAASTYPHAEDCTLAERRFEEHWLKVGA